MNVVKWVLFCAVVLSLMGCDVGGSRFHSSDLQNDVAVEQGAVNAPPPSSDSKSIKAAAMVFLNALTKRDMVKLFEFDPYQSFYHGGHLNRDIEEFIYGGDVSKIIYDPNLEIIPALQDDGTYIVIYVRRKDLAKIENMNFLSNGWPKLYFACHFKKEGEFWVLNQNFCFAETGGPFEVNE